VYVDTRDVKPAAVVSPAAAAFQFWMMVPGSAPLGSVFAGSDHTSFHTMGVFCHDDTSACSADSDDSDSDDSDDSKEESYETGCAKKHSQPHDKETSRGHADV
jgi:hypothetical protein